ncbi:cation diffusion facilitator family transporter [Rhizomicrobium palustre]|uniref:Cation diffusion facilitator family transporter n=1 Tax=Rhizomicrobium palustre TaxID=189966 RepID=A0A846N477_9PROT|nr:cation diffusion facilitator family transporter [Rhizomicrobium palustre]NIK90319.1 cation diffusion facilitator family transporter [Rhizomicrobium palustre]
MSASHSPDAAMKEKTSVALSSMAASLLMTIGKFVVGIMTGSLGLLSEALHSLLDFGATVLTFLAVRVSDKPADDEHHYGHGKMEAVAALAETALLFLTSAWIIYEAAHRLLTRNFTVEATWASFGVVIASIVIDISRARALMRTAKKTGSMALEADALHFSSDVLSSCVVLVGLGFVALGWPLGDPIAAIGVSIFVCRAGWKLGKRTFDALVDAAPEGAAEAIRQKVRTIAGVVEVKRVRIRPAGSVHFVDVEVAIGRGLTQTKVSELREEIEAAVRAVLSNAETTLTTLPLALNNETIYQRAVIIAANHGAHVHHVSAHHVEGKLSVSFDLEVNGRLKLSEAHQIATALETEMRHEFGAGTEVESHIEPMEDHALSGTSVEPAQVSEITAVLQRLAAENGCLSEVHNVRVRRIGRGLIVIFHCRTAPERTVEDIHGIVDELERRLRQSVPGIWRIVAHAEPLR